jgi:hypothetical protein
MTLPTQGQPQNPFEKYLAQAWPYWYEGELVVSRICGGVPAQENTAEAWIRAKLKDTRSQEEVKALVADTKRAIRETNKVAGRDGGETESETGLIAAEADALADISDEDLTELAVQQAARDLAGLNMFKRTAEGVLHIEGRQLKAALREAVSVAANAGKITTKNWGNPDNAAYKKQLKGWFPEHVFVADTTLPMYRADGTPVTKEDGILQKFVHTHRGDAIGYEEYVDNAVVRFTVKTDVDLTEEQWAMIWLTGQDQGLGASRSQGFGTYRMTGWKNVAGHETGATKAQRAKAAKAAAENAEK